MWQPVLMINGYLISVLGLAMLVPAFSDMYWTSASWSHFLSSSIICLFIGLSLYLANRMAIKKITLQQGYLITVCGWMSLTVLGTLPFVLSDAIPDFADAFFETMSGLSTTGATILPNVEAMPKAILLWRSVLSCLGGIGIVMFAVALLPYLGIGGMQIFQRENSDIDDKFMPKFNYIAKRIMFVYISLMLGCIFSLHWAGMPWFDAVNHGLSIVATCGLSIKNSSLGFYDSLTIEMLAALFLILSSLPMTFYIMIIQNQDMHSFRTQQVVTFLKVLAVYILATSCWLVFKGVYGFGDALRYASFNIISVVTSAGFCSTDYMAWGAFAGTLFMIFALTGGCTGSTSGSIKIFRWQAIFAFIRQSLTLATDPNRVLPVKIGSLTAGNAVMSSVFVFFAGYMLSIAAVSVLVALTGEPFEIAFSAAIASITNSGPGVGKIIGPSGNYSSLSDVAKYILAFAMLLGRLEVVTILVVFTKNFWRK